MATNGRRTGRPFIGSTERRMRNSTGSLRRKRRMVRGCRHSSRAWDTRSLTVNMRLPAKVLLERLASSVYIAGSSRPAWQVRQLCLDTRARLARCECHMAVSKFKLVFMKQRSTRLNIVNLDERRRRNARRRKKAIHCRRSSHLCGNLTSLKYIPFDASFLLRPPY